MAAPAVPAPSTTPTPPHPNPPHPTALTRARRHLPRLGALVFLAAIGYLVIAPLVGLQRLAFEDDARGYSAAFDNPDMAETLGTTAGLALGSLTIALVLGTFLAWAATRLPPRLRLLRVLPILPIVIPAVAAVTGWAFLFSPRPGYLNAALRNLPWWDHLDEGPVDIYTLPWIVLITGFGLTAFVYLFVSAGFGNINAELIEAAQVSGSSAAGVFFRVTLPLLRPTLVYGGFVALLLGLGQFTGPLLLGRNNGINVLTTDMYVAVSQSPVDYGRAAAIGSPLLLFGIAVVFFQKVVLGDHSRFVTHGGKAFRSGGRPSWVAVTGIVLYSLVALALPLGALTVVSLSAFWSGKIQPSGFTLDNFRRVFQESGITDAIVNSLTTSVISVAIALPLGFIAASLLLKGRRFRIIRAAVDFIVAMPLGIPAVVFGAGFLLTYSREPFILYGTRTVIVLVYVTLMLPFATRMQLSGMVALGDTYLEASRTSGAGALRTNTEIVLPLLRPTLAGAGALMFVLLTHEFTASLLVRAPTTQVMGTILFDYWSNGSYPLVAAIALVMTLVTSAGVFVAMSVAGSDIFEKL
ncbi:ABC transporter permease [Streptomyces sporangiiformans]|uniref:Iron ABC transporter permease n=1 Tax=Streptomyces sporangiiformans TaxID=2315329 RepID=A0A505D9J9_9ACTN|nr:iron ABC transporter permease [Streptomyces sporangiiformans]TPQ19062.1 iron ABC transporter permease [Streptomyces sporangiiformans]